MEFVLICPHKPSGELCEGLYLSVFFRSCYLYAGCFVGTDGREEFVYYRR